VRRKELIFGLRGFHLQEVLEEQKPRLPEEPAKPMRKVGD
jgi:hypothetical protein